MSAFCKSCGHDDGCAHEPGPGASIESIIRDYTVGAKRDCYVGGRKIELAERARAELDALTTEAERLRAHLGDTLEAHAKATATLARYEAPGPSLLVAEHDPWCTRGDDGTCCTGLWTEVAYREQHARCVAAVERLLRAAEKSADEADWSGSVMADAAAIDAFKACLAALKDGAK